MDPPRTTTGGKLRVMCSYGGYIIPRPHSKSLCYVGGETRIVSLAASSASLSVSSLIAHLASTLRINSLFTVKYQLPHHDLDALISISSEDDLQIMLEELERLSASPDSSRIRLFLFPIKPNSPIYSGSGSLELGQLALIRGGFSGAELTRTELSQVQSSRSGLNHPKTESWFVDALRGAKLGQKGDGAAGFGGEGGGDGQSESNGLSGQESIVLETSSSFGSTSSSVSLSNLPPITEANLQQYQDCNLKLPSPVSIAITSDGNARSGISCIPTMPIGACNDPVVPIAAMECKLLTTSYEPESKVPDLPYGVQMHRSAQVSGHAVSPHLNLPQQQNLQTVDVGSHYVPQNPSAVQQVAASYIPVYHPIFQPQPQQTQYPSDQPPPLYYVPLAQTQHYNYPVQCGLVHTSMYASGQPQMLPNASGLPPRPQLLVKEVAVAPPPVPELTSQVYRNVPTGSQAVHTTYEQDPGHAQIHHQPQSFAVASVEAANHNNEPDDDPARIQIYKSQPPPPISPSKYQTMTKATTALLSEAFAQLQSNDIKQQMRTSEPL